jgi:hypothetical protein
VESLTAMTGSPDTSLTDKPLSVGVVVGCAALYDGGALDGADLLIVWVDLSAATGCRPLDTSSTSLAMTLSP